MKSPDMEYILFSIISLLLLAIQGARQKSHFNFDFTEMRCSRPNPGLRRLDCGYHKRSRNIYNLDLHFVPDKDYYKNIDVRFRIDLLQDYAKIPLRIADVRFDACEYLKVMSDNFILRILLSEMQRTGNITMHCPFKAGLLYEYNNMTFVSTTLPPYTPDANITFTMDILDQDVVIGQQFLRCAVTSNRNTRPIRNKTSTRR